ncbi:MAG: hypothetical protein BACD_04005 [Bacteroides rodentium]
MKAFYIFLLSCCSSILCCAQISKGSASWESLQELDRYIADKAIYEQQKDDRIQLLIDKLQDHGLSLEERYRYMYSLFEEYSSYKYSLMHESARQLINLAQQIGDKEKLVEAEVCLAYSHLWGGAFKEAYEYALTIDTVQTSNNAKADYLMFLLNLNFESGLFVKSQRFFMKSNEEKMLALINCMEELLPDNDDRLVEARQKECFHSDKFQQSYILLMKRLEYTSGISRSTSSKIGDVGFLNLEMGDTLAAIKYMAEAAIIDIQLGSRQTPALRKLSETLYACGDVQKAYEYIQLSVQNAVFFDSRYRMFESTPALLDIDKTLYDLTKEQKDKLVVAIWVIIIAVISLIISLVIIRCQNRKLSISKSLIEEQNHILLINNTQIGEINKELSEVNRIKNAYLGRTLAANSSTILRIEDLVQVVQRKLKARQYDDILNFIKRNDYSKERDMMLADFDKMFLELFPDFIMRFNSLLREDNKIIVKRENGLTPELRIFALIRLGITKSDAIAEILNYSASTVRNYKTKIRNFSTVSNEEFDKKLMEIES